MRKCALAPRVTKAYRESGSQSMAQERGQRRMPGDEATDLPRRRRGLQELPSHLIYPLPAILRAIHIPAVSAAPVELQQFAEGVAVGHVGRPPVGDVLGIARRRRRRSVGHRNKLRARRGAEGTRHQQGRVFLNPPVLQVGHLHIGHRAGSVSMARRRVMPTEGFQYPALGPLAEADQVTRRSAVRAASPVQRSSSPLWHWLSNPTRATRPRCVRGSRQRSSVRRFGWSPRRRLRITSAWSRHWRTKRIGTTTALARRCTDRGWSGSSDMHSGAMWACMRGGLMGCDVEYRQLPEPARRCPS